jgi:hypothetical protein
LSEAESTADVIASYTDPSSPELRSRDGKSGVILVHIVGSADDAAAPANRIITALPTDYPDVTVRAGGVLGVQRQIEDRVNHDLAISESVALPILFVVLIIVFGGRAHPMRPRQCELADSPQRGTQGRFHRWPTPATRPVAGDTGWPEAMPWLLAGPGKQ